MGKKFPHNDRSPEKESAMKKVAVFGNAGGGKSTLSKKLSEITGLPLYVSDKIKYRSDGTAISDTDYKQIHAQILASDRWLIDGFGSLETIWLQLDAADSLIFIDLPLYVHFGWVTKRLLVGYFKPPEGWPENSPIFQSSMKSYRALWLCHKYLTPKYREYVDRAQSTKCVYHLKSTKQISHFWNQSN
jgi:adenylate kinase family enzyme